MLRATIAVAAAGLGGADAITVLPYTAPLGLPDAFARRIARNTQLLLLEESNLARVADPAAGSGALEALTARALHRGVVAVPGDRRGRRRLGGARSRPDPAKSRRGARRARRKPSPGARTCSPAPTNFRIFTKRRPAVLDVRRAAACSGHRQPPHRGAAADPARRTVRSAARCLRRHARHRPARGRRFFSPSSARRRNSPPRATFAKNFFEAGGIEAVERRRDDAPARLPPRSRRRRGARLPVLVGQGLREGRAIAAAQALKAAGARHIYLAGRPGEHEAALRAAGVQSFIYDGCDALATLRAAYDMLGVENG